jgi:hypothetical protein
MTRYVLSANIGQRDDYKPAPRGDEVIAHLNVLNFDNHLKLGMRKSIEAMNKAGAPPSRTGTELLFLAALVAVADTHLNREQTSQDNWTREIGIILPVLDVQMWVSAKPTLEKMLRFLTGDIWSVDFRPFPFSNTTSRPVQRELGGAPFDAVSLFSGGLDSLIGAIDNLTEAKHRTFFVSHRADGSISKPQQDLFEKVVRRFKTRQPKRIAYGMGNIGDVFPDIQNENSTRGRSFLFIALAAFAGSSLTKPFPIFVPENGLISLNVPLDPTRLGSNSTRTTHPFYFHRWNELLGILGIAGRVQNPYWNKTKGEMIVECKDHAFLRSVAGLSLSCAHPAYDRYNGGGKPHCGYCLPCIIRRAAFNHAKSVVPDPSAYRVEEIDGVDLDSTTKKGEQFRGFEFAVQRLSEKPSRAASFVFKTGPLAEDMDQIGELSGVYFRGMMEVASFMKKVETFSSKATDG